MAYWKLKSCPRCNGDVFVDTEDYKRTEVCLQCGARDFSIKKLHGEIRLKESEARELTAVH